MIKVTLPAHRARDGLNGNFHLAYECSVWAFLRRLFREYFQLPLPSDHVRPEGISYGIRPQGGEPVRNVTADIGERRNHVHFHFLSYKPLIDRFMQSVAFVPKKKRRLKQIF